MVAVADPRPASHPLRSSDVSVGDAGRVDALDGIRAVAVLAVIAFHVGAPGFGGGFLGVDVFFVLSGFLITRLLIHDVQRHGRIRLGTFWARRVRRLMPAFLVVIGVVVVWSATLAPAFMRDALRGDVVASLLYVANWHFIGASSYFADDGTDSPLEHVWSLAVEEQFYVVWPLVIAAVVALALRTARRRRPGSQGPTPSWVVTRIGLVALLAAGMSVLLLAVWSDPAAPERAYMGTDARAFEPLLGAALACASVRPAVRSWFARHASLLAISGLAVVGVGIAFLGHEGGIGSLYFHGGALAVTLACVALIGAAVAGSPSTPIVAILASAPLAAVGRISYGVYLWHWPLVVWFLPTGRFDPLRAAGVVVATLVAAALSYRFVETPIREGRVSAWLVPRRLVPVVLVALLAGVGTAHAVVQPGVAPSAASSVVMVGDSVPSRLMSALAAEGEQRDITVTSAARGSCPGLAIDVVNEDGSQFTEGLDCSTEVAGLQSSVVDSADADIVVWWSRYEVADRRDDGGHHLTAGTEEFWQAQREDLRRSIDRLTAGGATLVVVRTDRPGLGMYSRCTEEECHPFLRRLITRDDLRQRWNAELDRAAASDDRVRVITIDDAYCKDDAVPCDDSLGDGSYARPDGSHFSEAAMPVVAATLLERALASLG